MDSELNTPITLLRRILQPLQRYHRHRVEGMASIPRQGPVIVVVNHSLATYDGFLLGLAVYQSLGRKPYGLGDRSIFRIPGLRSFAESAGLVEASHESAHQLLSDGKLLFVAPGGMREALRPSGEKYQVRWHKRLGFARLALETQTPVVLAACPAADDIFTVIENAATKVVYRRLKLPLPLFRGVGPTPLPRPVQLTHYLSPLIQPPAIDPVNRDTQLRGFHAELVEQMQRLFAKHQ